MNIGIDIVECERVAGLVSEKVFSVKELDYIHQKRNALSTIAGLFAAKEESLAGWLSQMQVSSAQSISLFHR